MEVRELRDVFEKMYVQENETKEQITIRVQVVFTLMFAMVTVASYMLRMLDLDRYVFIGAGVVASLVVSFAFLAFASYFAIRAFWGNTFQQIPYAMAVKDYHGALVAYNNDVKNFTADGQPAPIAVDIKSEFETFLCNSYAECATHNSIANQERSRKVYESFRWLLCAYIPLGLAGVLFVGFDMDVSSPRKNFQIIDKYVGDQLGKVDASVGQIMNKTDELKEMLMSSAKSKSGEEDKKPAAVRPEPVKTAPLLPDPPKMRIILEDFQSRSVEVSNEPSKK